MGRGKAQPLYRLADALTARRGAEALERMEELLEEGEEPLRILGTLYRSLRQVLAAVGLREARMPRDEMLARLGLPATMAFKLPALLEASRAWPERELARALSALDRADRRIKTGGHSKVALTAAVVECCGGRGLRTSLRPGR